MTTQANKEAQGTPAGVSSGSRQRISTTQTLHLMRLEADRAIRHGYPISALVMVLDPLERENETELRKLLMPRLFQELKSVTFAQDVQGFGLYTEGLVVAVFPHFDPEGLLGLAEALLEAVRACRPEDVPDDLEFTASIGVSHNLHQGPKSFEILIEEAETGMGIAVSGGGDRVTQAREVERELDRLRAEVDHQLAELKEFQQNAFGGLDDADEIWGKQLIDKVMGLFGREPDKSEGLYRVEKEVIALLRYEIGVWRESSGGADMVEARRTIENLERRVHKLSTSLGLTEKELKKVAAMKNIDLGVASIYGSIQGLSVEEDNYEQKKEMLKNIFEANLALRG